jgi:hypothetical protein
VRASSRVASGTPAHAPADPASLDGRTTCGVPHMSPCRTSRKVRPGTSYGFACVLIVGGDYRGLPARRPRAGCRGGFVRPGRDRSNDPRSPSRRSWRDNRSSERVACDPADRAAARHAGERSRYPDRRRLGSYWLRPRLQRRRLLVPEDGGCARRSGMGSTEGRSAAASASSLHGEEPAC